MDSQQAEWGSIPAEIVGSSRKASTCQNVTPSDVVLEARSWPRGQFLWRRRWYLCRSRPWELHAALTTFGITFKRKKDNKINNGYCTS